MKTIYKYKIGPEGLRFRIDMPQSAQILTLKMQGDDPCIWALVDTERAPEPRFFTIYGTGHPMPEDSGQYVGTFLIEGGILVFHLFEDTK